MVAYEPLDIAEGRNELAVLSAIAEHQISSDLKQPKHKDIESKVTLSKGAVSNNCSKLKQYGLIEENSQARFTINKSRMMEVYKEHLEPLFVRERPFSPFQNQIHLVNDIRTEVKDNLQKIIRELKDNIFSLILSILTDARKNRKTNNLREVFQKTDQVMLRFGQILSNSLRNKEEITDTFKHFLSLAASIDSRYKYINTFSKSFSGDFEGLSSSIKEGNTFLKYLKGVR